MFPWGGHWPVSCCICMAESPLTFIKEQLSVAASTIAADRFSIRGVAAAASPVMEREALFGFCVIGFQGPCSTEQQRRWVSMQRGNGEHQIHWH